MTKEEQWLLDEKYDGIANADFEADRERLASGEPLAYIIGWQPFLGLKIFLDSHPLIPRPETEWWVEQLLHDLPSGADAKSGARRDGDAYPLFAPAPRLLDLCAGSGAIGCALLARVPEAHVSFGEIDPAHEATILKNIRENGLDESRAAVRIGDLFAPFENQKFDLIVANPPYIPEGRTLDASVADYEPAQALFAGIEGLDLIRRIARELPRHLAPLGEAWIEVDSAHAPAAYALFTAEGFQAEILADQYGRPRVIRVI